MCENACYWHIKDSSKNFYFGVSKIVSIFPSITIAAVLLKASFVKKTLHNFLNGELKLYATGQKPVNNIGKC